MRILFKLTVLLGLTGAILGTALALGIYAYLKPQLPSVEVLRDVRLQVPMRVFSADGKLIAEFGEKRRSPVVLEQVPENLRLAFLAAEDDRFEQHVGIDPMSLARAAFELISTGSIQSGGSTITMQVARNYFLTREQTFSRKFKEILLALEIEKSLSKDEILELYLNKIYLGKRAYGIGAAAQIYYDTDLDGLTLAQSAMIAGLPKAPSRFNPVNNPSRAQIRRDWILGRMLSLGFISEQEHQEAVAAPITASVHITEVELAAPWVAEQARFELEQKMGEEIYEAGLNVYLTVDSQLQARAQSAVMTGLLEYDRRHGWRGPEASEKTLEDLQAMRRQTGGLEPALVTAVNGDILALTTRSGRTIELDKDGWGWARPRLNNRDRMGPAPESPNFLSPGDVVRVPLAGTPILAQIPDAQAAFVGLNPQDGAIQAMIGGFDFTDSKFNRAILSNRQVGSSIKPFLYAVALENGFTPASIINDAPIVFDSGELDRAWRPQNSSGEFYGPTRLREALYRSRNLVSVRLMREMGINTAREGLQTLGLPVDELPRNLSLALGSGSISPLQMASLYATFANGGFKVAPYLIDRVEDARGNRLFETRPAVACQEACQGETVDPWQANALEEIPEIRLASETQTPRLAPRVLSESSYFLINSMMRDVVTRGTARRALVLDRTDLAGKTGTTNDAIDAWFSGYQPEHVAVSWVGIDNPESLGRSEFGGKAALPIWIDYMRLALKDTPEAELIPPTDVVKIRVNPRTGRPAGPGQESINEWFSQASLPETEAEETVVADSPSNEPVPRRDAPSAADAARLF